MSTGEFAVGRSDEASTAMMKTMRTEEKDAEEKQPWMGPSTTTTTTDDDDDVVGGSASQHKSSGEDDVSGGSSSSSNRDRDRLLKPGDEQQLLMEQHGRRPTESNAGGEFDDMSSMSASSPRPTLTESPETEETVSEDEPREPTKAIIARKPTPPLLHVKMWETLKEMTGPIQTLFARMVKRFEHEDRPTEAEPKLTEKQEEEIREKISAFPMVLIPLTVTFFLAYYRNGGPTLFSLHPIMMMTSMVSIAGSLLFQKMGGERNLRRQGWLALAGIISMEMGLIAVWATKEMYAKPHLMTIHSHLGGMVAATMYAYVIACYLLFNPRTAQRVRNLITSRSRNFHMYTGKTVAGLGLVTAMFGIVQLESSVLNMMLWVGSLTLFIPMLI